jgi:alanine dehydrogenase
VRGLADARVFSPTPENREGFARRAEAELGMSATACDTAQEAVADTDLVILATRSERPVIEAGWIRRGTHVNGRAETRLGARDTARPRGLGHGRRH